MLILDCPNCGPRNVSEYRFGGEYKRRPRNAEDAAADEAWVDYVYLKENKWGLQEEWWYHRAGCGLWFLARRHTKTHVVEATYEWQARDGV